MKPTEPFFIKKNGKWMISGKWAFWFQSVHGIPHEMLPDIVINFFKNVQVSD